MFDDKNKTVLSCKVTRAAFRYLIANGFKPVETEIWAAESWIADVMGVITPTDTEIQELRWMPKKPRYPNWKGATQKAKDKWNIENRAWNEAVMKFYGLSVALVEVKTSRADFRADKKWSRPMPVDFSYLMFPAGMIAEHEYPPNWGILEYYAKSDTVRLQRVPVKFETSQRRQLEIILEIALRRHNRELREGTREQTERIREDDNQRKSATRISTAVMAVADIVHGRGDSIEDCLAKHRVKKVPYYVEKELQAMWRIGVRDGRSGT